MNLSVTPLKINNLGSKMTIVLPASPSGDGLSNSEEYQIGTNPRREDMDGDFLLYWVS